MIIVICVQHNILYLWYHAPNKHKAEMRMITPIPRKYLHNSGIKIESEKTCIFLILHGSYKQAKTIYSQILRKKKTILIRHYVFYHMCHIILTDSHNF